ncbi:plakophilin-2 [Pholidichthys leucotaenia]
MEEVFFKSALPPQDSSVLGDSSLALPADTSLGSSTKLDPKRSQRVQQQVQLTLARKARRSLSSDGITLQKQKSFDGSDGFSTDMKVRESGIYNHSVSISHLQKPSRRVEVSPQASPELPPSHFTYNTYHYGTYTHPGPSHSHAVGTLQCRSVGPDSFRRYAFSESPLGPRTFVSTAVRGSSSRRSLKQTAGSKFGFANSTLQQNGEYGSRWNHRQSMIKQEKSTLPGHNGDMMLGFDEPDEGLSWLTQVRKEGKRSFRLNSYPPSTTSLEVDVGRHLDIPVQQIKTENVTTLKSENKPLEMTLERALNLLTEDDEEKLIHAVSFIQNQCFQSADAKKKVQHLCGIGKLLQLLNNDSEEVQRLTAGALRNVVYQSNRNKMEVKENDGLALIIQTLVGSHDMETRRQLTGLLWNLSSHDVLKEHLPRNALSVLTRSVLVPGSGMSEGENPKDELLADADAFYNATGCLRNLSSAGPDVRRAMRDCENLIDSLVYYVRGTIANYNTDDKSTENCACILHNLSYQIESELPQNYTQILRESRQDLATQPKTLGCFSYRGAKITEHQERQLPLLEEKANPSGIDWLWCPITVRMYLSLVACSMRHCTQEAAIGALQNITAGNGAVAEAIAFTIVQRENGLQHIKKILEEGETKVKRTAVLLIKNLSRYQELHPAIANQVLPELVRMLPSGDSHASMPGEVTASLCQILVSLSQSDMKNVKAIINNGGLPKVINISNIENGYGPSRSAQAACVLLHTMWKHTDLHSALRRSGFKKSDFINARTTRVMNSK